MLYDYEANKEYFKNRLRRLRAYHSGKILDGFLSYEVAYSFLKNKYKNVYISHQSKIYSINTKYRIKYGNIKIPFTLDSYSSSKYITFMERALGESFLPSRRVGIELLLSNKINSIYTNLFLSSFANSLDDKLDNLPEKRGYSSRLTFAYKFNKRHILSLGTGYLKEDYYMDKVKFKESSESDLIDDKYVSVKIKDVDNIKKYNFELLYINNKYSLQSEYMKVDVNSIDKIYSFDSFYIQGSYFIVGFGKRYKLSTSTLSNVKPNSDGALEVAFRYSTIDLNDKDEHGGSQTDYTSALNWYISKEFKVSFNYIIAMPKDTDDYDGLLQLVQVRTLFAF